MSLHGVSAIAAPPQRYLGMCRAHPPEPHVAPPFQGFVLGLLAQPCPTERGTGSRPKLPKARRDYWIRFAQPGLSPPEKEPHRQLVVSLPSLPILSPRYAQPRYHLQPSPGDRPDSIQPPPGYLQEAPGWPVLLGAQTNPGLNYLLGTGGHFAAPSSVRRLFTESEQPCLNLERGCPERWARRERLRIKTLFEWQQRNLSEVGVGQRHHWPQKT